MAEHMGIVFSPYGSLIILRFISIKHLHEFLTGLPAVGALNTGGV